MQAAFTHFPESFIRAYNNTISVYLFNKKGGLFKKETSRNGLKAADDQ